MSGTANFDRGGSPHCGNDRTEQHNEPGEHKEEDENEEDWFGSGSESEIELVDGVGDDESEKEHARDENVRERNHGQVVQHKRDSVHEGIFVGELDFGREQCQSHHYSKNAENDDVSVCDRVHGGRDLIHGLAHLIECGRDLSGGLFTNQGGIRHEGDQRTGIGAQILAHQADELRCRSRKFLSNGVESQLDFDRFDRSGRGYDGQHEHDRNHPDHCQSHCLPCHFLFVFFFPLWIHLLV